MKIRVTFILAMILGLTSCYKAEDLNVPANAHSPSDDPIDVYVQTNFTNAYGIAVRYKFVDRYVNQMDRVAPPKREVVIPMLQFINNFWIEPFTAVPNGNQFFRKHVPAEIVFIGSYIYNSDGTVKLGIADAGARITLTNVNDINTSDKEWVFLQLGTIYHEFAHIMHQRYNLPPNWQKISPQGYTSAGSWYNLSDEEALQRGFVSPYATVSFNEDFAELAAFLLFHPQFYEIYINDETNCNSVACVARNEGRAKLRTKLNALLSHYQQSTGVDLLKVRAIVQQKLL